MAELTTLARPYAKAAFEYAREQNDLDSWSKSLGTLAAVASDSTVKKLLDSPAITSQKKATALADICGTDLTAKVKAYIEVLAENKRLNLIATITDMFEILKAQQEKFSDVKVTAAFAMDKSVETALLDKLKTVLLSDVSITTSIDKSLIGGVVVRSGDMVIDGSVKGRLSKLSESLGL